MKEMVNFKGLMIEIRVCAIEGGSFHEVIDSLTEIFIFNLLTKFSRKLIIYVTNFIQLVSPQLVDQFSQTKLHCKASNKGYPHICGMYKSDNK